VGLGKPNPNRRCETSLCYEQSTVLCESKGRLGLARMSASWARFTV